MGDCKAVIFLTPAFQGEKDDELRGFGQHLRRLRTARGWSRQALADVCDMSKLTIYRLETARSR